MLQEAGANVRKLTLYIAASLDGYIAGPNGEIDWLEAGGDADYGCLQSPGHDAAASGPLRAVRPRGPFRH